MTPEVFARWALQHRMLEEDLARVEQAERAILERLKCPTDPVGIYDVLDGRRRAPWPTRTAACDRERAKHAMFALLAIGNVRQHTSLGADAEDAGAAAQAALMAGLLAGDAARHAVQASLATRTAVKGGTARGQKIAATAARHDTRIAGLARQWRHSDELREQYGERSPVNYIRKRTRLTVRTIQRALQRISRQ